MKHSKIICISYNGLILQTNFAQSNYNFSELEKWFKNDLEQVKLEVN